MTTFFFFFLPSGRLNVLLKSLIFYFYLGEFLPPLEKGKKTLLLICLCCPFKHADRFFFFLNTYEL